MSTRSTASNQEEGVAPSPCPAESAPSSSSASAFEAARSALKNLSREEARLLFEAEEQSEAEVVGEGLWQETAAFVDDCKRKASNTSGEVDQSVVLLEQMLKQQAAMAAKLQKLEQNLSDKEAAKRGDDIPEAWKDIFTAAVVNGREVEEASPQWLYKLSVAEKKELNKRYPKLAAFDISLVQHEEKAYNAMSKEKRDTDKLLKDVMSKEILTLRILAKWAKELEENISSPQELSYDATCVVLEDLVFQVRDNLTWARMKRLELVHGREFTSQAAQVIDDKKVAMLPGYLKAGLSKYYEEDYNVSELLQTAGRKRPRDSSGAFQRAKRWVSLTTTRGDSSSSSSPSPSPFRGKPASLRGRGGRGRGRGGGQGGPAGGSTGGSKSG